MAEKLRQEDYPTFAVNKQQMQGSLLVFLFNHPFVVGYVVLDVFNSALFLLFLQVHP